MSINTYVELLRALRSINKMGIRTGLIRESSKREIHDASREIVHDVLEDGGSKREAMKYIFRLVLRANKDIE